MTFPTSGLVDNQVHKEGNRSFVYDSTLLVWDQVPEAPETISILGAGKVLDDVTLGSSVVFPVGHVLQVVTGEIDAGGGDIALSGASPGTEISTSMRFSIVPKSAGSKIIISYSTLRTYCGEAAHIHVAIGHEVTASGGTATAATLLGQLVTSGGHDQGTHAYWWIEELGAASNPHYFETFHSPSYTVGQRVWYSPIGWVSTGTQYFSLDSDIRCKIIEIKA